jgi:hypothetical protein
VDIDGDGWHYTYNFIFQIICGRKLLFCTQRLLPSEEKRKDLSKRCFGPKVFQENRMETLLGGGLISSAFFFF